MYKSSCHVKILRAVHYVRHYHGWGCQGRRYGALRGVGGVRVGVTERYVGVGGVRVGVTERYVGLGVSG